MKLRTRMLIERLVEESVQDAFDETRIGIHPALREKISRKIFDALDSVFEYPTEVKIKPPKETCSRT